VSGSFDTQTVGSSCPDESDVAERGVGPEDEQLIGAHTGGDALLCAVCHAELAAKGSRAPEPNDLLQPCPGDWQDIGETARAETSPAEEAGCLDMSKEISALFDEGEATGPTSPVVLNVAAAAPQPEAGSEESLHKAAGAAAEPRQHGFKRRQLLVIQLASAMADIDGDPKFEQPMVVKVCLNGQPATALIDTGAAADILYPAAAERLGIPVQHSHAKARVVMADQTQRNCARVARDVHVRVGDGANTLADRETLRVADLPAAGHDLILGMPFLAAHNPVPDYKERRLTFADGAIAIALADQPPAASVHADAWQSSGSSSNPTLRRRLLEVLCLQRAVRSGEDIQVAMLRQVEQTADDDQVQAEMPPAADEHPLGKLIIAQYARVFQEGLPPEREVEHIELTPGSRPPVLRCNRHSKQRK
jgi:Aspartyl protease